MAHLRKENVQLRAVHLIDTAYGGEKYRKSAVRAQRLFAGWFQEAWPGRWEVRDVHYDGFCFVCWVLQDMEVNLQLGKQSKPHHQRQSHIFVGRPKIKTESRTKGINKTPKERSKSWCHDCQTVFEQLLNGFQWFHSKFHPISYIYSWEYYLMCWVEIKNMLGSPSKLNCWLYTPFYPHVGQ